MPLSPSAPTWVLYKKRELHEFSPAKQMELNSTA